MTTPTDDLPHASLYFKQGGSDKEYHARVVKAVNEPGFIVMFAYGRRGSTLTTGTKTSNPTSLDEASQVFQRLVSEKERKGYQRGGNGVQSAQALQRPTANAPHAHYTPPTDHAPTGPLPQLLNELSEDALPAFLKAKGDTWSAQEKYDGKNVVLSKYQFAVHATNKHGLKTDIALTVAESVAALHGDFIIMGEAMGERFAVHNVVEVDGTDCRASSYESRYAVVQAIVGKGSDAVFVATLITGASEILAFYKRLKARGAEGMVLKELTARHTDGRPNSGGTQLKVKFWADCSCIVSAVNTARSVAVRLGDVEMGNVTIPPNKPIPKVGAIVDVKYLYAYRGGSLYQPQYRGERDDVKPAECTIEKQRIKFKAAVQE